jgi:spoIIIJ-associated protein
MKIQEFLTQLCEHCGVDVSTTTITVEEDDEYIRVHLELTADDSGLFIGYHGETLEAIQRMLRLVFQRAPEDKRIILNINQYREQREEKLTEMAIQAARQVLETGEEYAFDTTLGSHERFVIHSALSALEEFEGLESVSEGVGRDRRLHIRKK